MDNWLFEHNQTAYNAAVSLLNKTGKAAIIHPTGTGKSFIGFKLCLDNPDSKVCWLSPSSYIFATQLENVKKATGGILPNNIVFFTYAKLMLLSSNEIDGIKPDYIILDEFHRCGAQMWGGGVDALLSANIHVPILGLSATAIRYLDNQRDMADELFDGCVASEITLGEAIVRGILSPPKYVLSIYSYNKDLTRYQKKIDNAQSKAVRDAAQLYLDELRRRLDMSDGLDKIFARHTTNPSSKYIVFCSNINHMRQMVGKVPEWFGKIDTSPHVYVAYSNNPETSKAFAEFKDDSSTHLKLLFCIDMLNEGIHIDDIDGVILLRPTVSPIIYKQQIGRALSANKNRTVIIFDIVMNILNLYSIGSIEQEIQAAVTYYRFLGEESNIVSEKFQIIDELRDCKELFERLNDTLSASWDVMYKIAKRYYEQHGNLTVPNRYKTTEGYSLGNWVATQRSIRKGISRGYLSEEQIRKLDAIGMQWEYSQDIKWKQYFNALCKYRDEFGHINIPGDYVSGEGIKLGRWIEKLRTYHNSSVRTTYLTPDRIHLLDAMGMIWGKTDYLWERNYQLAAQYYQKHNNIRIKRRYITNDGIALGTWIYGIYKRYHESEGASLTPIQKERLEAIGMVFPSTERYEEQWHKGYSKAKDYFIKNGDLNVPAFYKTKDGFALGLWIRKQRKSAKVNESKPQIKLPQTRINLLTEIGMVWDLQEQDPWWQNYSIAKKYYDEHGNLNMLPSDQYAGISLGSWLVRQRAKKRKGMLSPIQVDALNKLEFNWMELLEQKWEESYISAKAFFEQNGHLLVPPSNKVLTTWLKAQRVKKKEHKLTDEQILRLNSIGMVWEENSKWIEFFKEAEAYYEEKYDLDIPATYITESGLCLGRWYRQQRDNYKNGKLTKEQILLLESIGACWEPFINRKWDEHYALAKEFYEGHGHLRVPASFSTSSGVKLGKWISSQRENYAKGKLSQNQIDRLKQIAFEGNRFDSLWELGFNEAKKFYLDNANLSIPSTYITNNGFRLGAWINTQRNKYKTHKLSGDQITRLENLGMIWSPQEQLWNQGYLKAKQYAEVYGTLDIATGYVTEDGYRLGQWLNNQKKKYLEKKLDDDKIKRLSQIGFKFSKN